MYKKSLTKMQKSHKSGLKKCKQHIKVIEKNAKL